MGLRKIYVSIVGIGFSCLFVASLLNLSEFDHDSITDKAVALAETEAVMIPDSPIKFHLWTKPAQLQLLEDVSTGAASGQLPMKWVEDSTVSQGTYVQKDNSARLINPWAYESDAFDLRRDRPFDWFDDDDPREANRVRIILPSRN